ncbi:hypothetical protein OG21DRAFT_850074 [Imleria badia]|nr:hypothetical protein OG21DRAFT_850074 [Imleria badia]
MIFRSDYSAVFERNIRELRILRIALHSVGFLSWSWPRMRESSLIFLSVFRAFKLASHSICEVRPCLFNGVYQPSLQDALPTGKILLLSYFCDRIILLIPPGAEQLGGTQSRRDRRIGGPARVVSRSDAYARLAGTWVRVCGRAGRGAWEAD